MDDVTRLNESIKQARIVRDGSDDAGTVRRLNQAMKSLKAARRRKTGSHPGDVAEDVEGDPDASSGWRDEYHEQGVDRER